MAYGQWSLFRGIVWLVLMVFYTQTLNPVMLGYAPWYGSPPTRAESVAMPVWQRLLDFVISPAQAQTGDPLLASTPEFDLADPYLVEKANELGKDPQRIFAFVRDQIGFESYAGSLRGARGTLWSNAGNALDKASLLVALLRISNIPAQYVQGTLADSDARQLILSMFPAPLRVVGCLDPGTEVADPANDPQLLSETRQHYWVRFNGQDADPNFAGAQIGQTFAAAQSAFVEAPDNLRHKVTVRLKRELTTPLAGLFTGGAAQDIATVLEQTFNSVELVGRSLSIGHFVNTTSLSAVITSITHTYSPYLLLNQKDGNVVDDDLARGADYQELLTNFPFGSQILTGLFLEISVSFPEMGSARLTDTVQKTLLDRIGFTTRQNGGALAVDFSTDAQPVISELDIVTLEVATALQLEYPALQNQQRNLERITTQIDSLIPALEASPADSAPVDQMLRLSRQYAQELTSLIGGVFLTNSDRTAQSFGEMLLTRGYSDSPRLVTVRNLSKVDAATQQASNRVEVDILRNASRSYAYPAQAQQAARQLRFAKGLADSILEEDVLTPESFGGANVTSAIDVFLQALAMPGAHLKLLLSENLNDLSTLDLSEEAKIRITQSVQGGKNVLAPSASVVVNGKARAAWLETNPSSGETISVLDDGTHNSASEYAAIQKLTAGLTSEQLRKIGVEVAKELANEVNRALVRGGPKAAARLIQIYKREARIARPFLAEIVSSFLGTFVPMVAILRTDELFFNFASRVDPPIGALLFSGPPSPEFAALDSGDGSGVTAAIIPDSIFSAPVAGAELPSIFKLGFKNRTTTADSFALNFTNVPAGFTAETTVPQITIPPGETAEVGVCLRPTAGLPAPGTNADFSLQVTSTTNPALTTTANQSFAVPTVSGVTLASSPTALATSPGTPVQATLTVQAVGNTPTNATLSLTASAGLTVTGLSPSVSLNPGESSTQTLTLTPSAGTPLNSVLVTTIKADFGGAQPQILTIPVQVAAPGAQSAVEAAVAAGQLGNTDLAARLNDLSLALTSLVQDPNSAVFKGQVLANIDSIISQVANDPNLAALAASLTNARNALAAATDSSAVLAAVNSIGSALDAFNGAIGGQAQYNFTLSLLPNTQVAQSQTPVPFQVIVQNTGADQATYDLSVSGLPAGVTSQFTPASVTLAPGATTAGNAPILTLTQTSTTQLAAFPFTVTATVQQSSPPVSRTTQGSLTIRNELVSVASVTANPPFADPGVSVAVSARLLNTVNQSRQVQVSYSVVDGAGQTVLPSSSPVAATLTVQTSLITVDLGALDTTNLAVGDYTLRVTVNDPSAPATPLATGQGSLLIGSPVTASLTLNPDVLPPGDGASTATLQISSRLSAVPPLTLLGQTSIGGGATGVAVKDNLAYVCGDNGIHIVDVSNPNLPSVLKTFGSGSRGCLLQGNLLLAIQGFDPSFTVQVYSIKDPQNPVLLGASPTINYSLPFDIQATASHAFVVQFQYCFFVGSNQIFLQTGDLLSLALNLDNPANPTVANPALLNVLFNNNGDNLPAPGDTPGCPANGGNNNIRQMAQADAQTVLLASTTATGAVTTGLGRIFSVDVSNPAQLNVVNELLIPGIVHAMGIALDGNRALVVGSTGGLNSGGDLLLTGNLAFTVLDVSNPRAPQILGSQTTSLPARTFWTTLSALGNGLFAFARGVPGANEIQPPQLVLINASDPANIVVGQPTDTPDNIIGPNAIQTANNLLFATGNTAGLLIYQLGQPPSVPVTAKVQIPRNTGVTAGSFNIQPTQILNGGNFDTLVWDLNFASGASGQTITWQTGMTDLLPGESRPVTGDTQIDFTVQGTDAQIVLPPLKVTSQQILALAPTTRTVKPGEAASYTVTVQNPTATAVTYTLAVQGVPSEWVNLASSLAVPPNSAQDVALTLVSDLFAANGDYGFVMVASVGGVTGSVTGNLTLQGQSPPPPPVVTDSQARGVVLALSPAQATAGQGTPAFYTARVTNVGSETATFNLSGNFSTGIQAQFATTQVTLSPGASNFRDVALTLTPSPGAASGSYPFTVTATTVAGPTVTGQTVGTIQVLDLGVKVTLSAGATPLAATIQATNPAQFTLRVTNTGLVRETYDLTLAGPVALYATLAQQEITLDPGASQSILINVAAIDTALPGDLTLIGIATARSDTQVRDSATITLKVPVSRGLNVTFDPRSQTLPTPGPATFLLQVQNTGNTEEGYQAVITTTSGPVSAALEGLTGQPTQRIDTFRLPALATGLLTLDATLQQAGTGQVTVTVTTLDAPALTGADTATVTTQDQPPPPPPTSGEGTAIPTLSEWMQILMALLMLLALMGVTRRRRHP